MKNKIGFIIPNYSNERRVALLPNDVKSGSLIYIIEKGFGLSLGISDNEYEKVGCIIKDRNEIFDTCDIIFSLKLIQDSDYDLIREGQIIVGWTHPYGSGRKFMENQAIPKKLAIVDLDNISPKIYINNKEYALKNVPRNFICKNSILAGYASVTHALTNFGLKPDSNTKVAVLSSGNVAQGAFQAISHYGADVRMFYRKTIPEFLEHINEFDIIINGIEIGQGEESVINEHNFDRIKENSLIIDAAADAGNAIYGTTFTTHSEPIIKIKSVYYYCINNSPTLFYRTASKFISESFSKYIYSLDFISLIEDIIREEGYKNGTI